MSIGRMIKQLRQEAKLTQRQFSAIFGVSQQSVQKWESGISQPELKIILQMANHFNISLDALILGDDSRDTRDVRKTHSIKPQYQSIHDWEFYPSNLPTEYQQSIEEGLDIERYSDVFASIAKLPKGEMKQKLGDVLFEIITSAKQKAGYAYIEPSELEAIKRLRKNPSSKMPYDKNSIEDKILGAWMGRVCGCMLGKTIEGIHTDELIPFLTETKNYPMHRYIYRSDLSDDILRKYSYGFMSRCFYNPYRLRV